MLTSTKLPMGIDVLFPTICAIICGEATRDHPLHREGGIPCREKKNKNTID